MLILDGQLRGQCIYNLQQLFKGHPYLKSLRDVHKGTVFLRPVKNGADWVSALQMSVILVALPLVKISMSMTMSEIKFDTTLKSTNILCTLGKMSNIDRYLSYLG